MRVGVLEDLGNGDPLLVLLFEQLLDDVGHDHVQPHFVHNPPDFEEVELLLTTVPRRERFPIVMKLEQQDPQGPDVGVGPLLPPV